MVAVACSSKRIGCPQSSEWVAEFVQIWVGSWFGGMALEGFHVGGTLVEVATHLFLICHG